MRERERDVPVDCRRRGRTQRRQAGAGEELDVSKSIGIWGLFGKREFAIRAFRLRELRRKYHFRTSFGCYYRFAYICKISAGITEKVISSSIF